MARRHLTGASDAYFASARFTRASVGVVLLVATGVADHAHAQNWDGSGQLRVGAFLQGSYTDYDAVQSPAKAAAFRQSTPADGFGAGVSAGYDLRRGTFVIGVETDVTLTSGNGRPYGSTFDSYGTDYYATVRGRVGMMVHPSVLLYGTAGLAMLGAEYKFTGPGTVASATGVLDKKNANMTGTSIGGGVEYDGGWGIMFAEYLYNDYGGWTFLNFNGNRVAVDASGSVVRAGVKFKVGHDFDATDDLRRPPRQPSDTLK